ncbi:Ig-like domain-containing protein [Chitinimonas viridis]|uniref:Ig-like domain-containing protein n=1 Tax=Chitinimonas viridis TaxID=664880 RepID=A0ABT8B1T1_9NEIS|nr:Ig-like domain-containing protein [Chitinimonas viridis]MDN3575785.1 Ig-like domain-containing protein [Chitinimonas viridis]
MRKFSIWHELWRFALVLVAIALASCGGPGGSDSEASKKETLTLTMSISSLSAGQPATVTAVLKDGAGAPKVGQTITFTTDALFGIMSPASGVWITDSTGTATITLSSGPNIGSAAITATSSSGTKSSLSYNNTSVGVSVASLQLLVSSGNLLADGSSTIDVTALVKDANNNTVSGQTVVFSANSGALTVTNNGVSDAAGRASAVLSSGDDKTTRDITVTAKVGSLTATSTVRLAGTKITIAGVNSLVVGNNTQLTIRLQDGAGRAIAGQTLTLGSIIGNTFSVNGANVTSVSTDSSGQATVRYNAVNPGTDNISASALNERGTLAMAVSNQSFTVVAAPGQAGTNFPAGSSPEFNLDTPVVITARYLNAGVPQVGKTVTFTSTRGTISPASAITDASGSAYVTAQADTAGAAVITAESGSVSSQYLVEYVSIAPNKLNLQVESSTVAPRGKTAITATVRDAKNNLVKNKTVSFTLSDTTGGTLSVAKGVTDSAGQTSTTYTAGNTTSSKDSVVITATVQDTAVTSTARLTVAGQALFVRLGTGNTIDVVSATEYGMPYTAIVTDAAGNPVANAEVTFSVVPVKYYKGTHYWTGTTWAATGGTQQFTTTDPACPVGSYQVGSNGQIPPVLSCVQLLPATSCANEDTFVDALNGVGANNGILEPGEDFNGNGELDPGFVAAASPAKVLTNAAGSATIRVGYTKDKARWVQVALTARATVQGSEASSSAIFGLSGLAGDYDDETISPPGFSSPYGTSVSCSSPN